MAPSNYITKVAIVGATGTVGKYITKELLATGKHQVTALTRKSELPESPANNLTIAKIDYNDPATLTHALRDHDALIITLSVVAPPDTQDKLIAAAAQAGVRWVLPNEWGPDMGDERLASDVIMGHASRAARRRVEELGVSSWVGVVSGFWYEYSLAVSPNAYGLDWGRRTWTFFDEGETAINTITWPQSGRAVAKLLSLPIESASDSDPPTPSLSQYRNKFLYVSSFLLSQRDMFESVLRVSGTRREDWTVHYQDSEARFREGVAQLRAGDRAGFMKLLYTRVFFQDGGGCYEEKVDNEVLGLPREELDGFTRVALRMAEEGVTYPSSS